MAVRNLSYAPVTVAVAGTTTVCQIPTGENNVRRLGLSITNGNAGGGNPLDGFSIDVRSGTGTTWTTIAGPTTATDFSSPASPILRCAGAPVTLAAAATCWILMDVQGISMVRITASADTGTVPLSVEATLG